MNCFSITVKSGSRDDLSFECLNGYLNLDYLKTYYEDAIGLMYVDKEGAKHYIYEVDGKPKLNISYNIYKIIVPQLGNYMHEDTYS